jgi:periplasmic protein CpxP/Spy
MNMKQNHLQTTMALAAGIFLFLAAADASQTNDASYLRPKGQRGAMDPLQMMKQSLNLSDEQAKKLEPVLNEHREKINALRRDTSLTRQQRMAKLREMEQGRDAKIRAHLTPEQAEIWEKTRQGQGGAFQSQGPAVGNGSSLPAGLQAEKAQEGLPNWRSRAPQLQQSQPQPAQPAKFK